MPPLLTVEQLVLGYLAYVTAVAWLGGRPQRARLVLTGVAAADATFIVGLASLPSPAAAVAREWLPPLQVLIGYWLSGLLFEQPMPRVERWLVRSDEWIAARTGARRLFDATPNLVLELLELAYLTVSPMVPLGFALVFFLADTRDADRFWTVVVSAELGCYAMLPWIQTRPPFATMSTEFIERRNLLFRRWSRAFMRKVSIHVNTLPSGHAAGSLATALVVWEQLPAAGPWFLAWALLIVVGSIVGRNHYAIDAVTGMALALVVWGIV